MRKLIFLFIAICGLVDLSAQTPSKFPYQAVIRDNAGALLTEQAITIQFSIRQSSMSGVVVYQETQNVRTSNIGVINVAIGNGTSVSGSISDIDWSSGSYFLEIAYDLTGGSNYVLMGTTQLISVPYTLHARTAESTVARSKSDRDGITIPKIGQLLFCTDCGVEGELQVYNGTKWTNLIGGDVVE